MATLHFVCTIPGTGFHVAAAAVEASEAATRATLSPRRGRRRQLIRSWGRRAMATAHAPLPRSPALLFLLSSLSFPVHNARKHNRFAVRLASRPPPSLTDKTSTRRAHVLKVRKKAVAIEFEIGALPTKSRERTSHVMPSGDVDAFCPL